MTVQLELWQAISLLLMTFGGFWGLVRWIALDQRQALTERFDGMERARKEAAQHWNDQFAALLTQLKQESEGWQALERDFLRFQAELPVLYVRREDYIRGQSVLEAKLDALYSEVKLVQLKGAKHHE